MRSTTVTGKNVLLQQVWSSAEREVSKKRETRQREHAGHKTPPEVHVYIHHIIENYTARGCEEGGGGAAAAGVLSLCGYHVRFFNSTVAE